MKNCIRYYGELTKVIGDVLLVHSVNTKNRMSACGEVPSEGWVETTKNVDCRACIAWPVTDDDL